MAYVNDVDWVKTSLNPKLADAIHRIGDGLQQLEERDCVESADKLSTSHSIDGVLFDGSNDISHYCICDTSGSIAAKAVTVPGFTLVPGANVLIKFKFTNTATSPTLDVSGTGARPMHYNGVAIDGGSLIANSVHEFVYDGNVYVLVGGRSASSIGASSVSERVEHPLTVQLNDGQVEGTDKFIFNGAAPVNINLTSHNMYGVTDGGIAYIEECDNGVAERYSKLADALCTSLQHKINQSILLVSMNQAVILTVTATSADTTTFNECQVTYTPLTLSYSDIVDNLYAGIVNVSDSVNRIELWYHQLAQGSSINVIPLSRSVEGHLLTFYTHSAAELNSDISPTFDTGIEIVNAFAAHSHNYAGSDTPGGSAASALALGAYKPAITTSTDYSIPVAKRGTWEPATTSLSISDAYGGWMRLGAYVQCWFKFKVCADVEGATVVSFSGLPYSISNPLTFNTTASSAYGVIGAVSTNKPITTNEIEWAPSVIGCPFTVGALSTTFVLLRTSRSDGSTTPMTVTDFNKFGLNSEKIASVIEFTGQFSYITNEP